MTSGHVTATSAHFSVYSNSAIITNMNVKIVDNGIFVRVSLVLQVWVNAAAQTFNSLGIAFGGIITMASYNKTNNNTILK